MERKRVPITKEDTQKSYYKYYLMDMAPVPKEKYDKILRGPIPFEKALPFSQRNRLFDEGYMEEETGYCVMPDGTGYLANLTYMPNVTTEMFDWWFAWHSLDNLRYTIWNPEDHYKAETQNRSHALDTSLSYRERLWDTSHDIVEDIGMGPENIVIHFKNPGDLGFDTSKIGTKACSTIVTGKGVGKGQPPFASRPTIMTHFVREVEGGIELRSRFWMGWTYENGRDINTILPGTFMPPMGPMTLALHNIKEFTNLASILPKVFAEEKNNF